MLKTLMDTVLQSYVAPRKAMRQVLGHAANAEAVAIIFGLSFCLQAIFVIIVDSGSASAQGGVGSMVLSSLLLSAVMFAIMTVMVFWIGRSMGGRGSLLGCAAAIAWHSLVSVVFAPIITMGGMSDPEEVSAIIVLGQLASVGMIVWLMASFIAEVHEFPSTMRVALALIGGFILVGLLLSFLFAGLISTT